MKFSDDYSQSHIYEDLQSIDWYSAFDYQYKHFDIRYLKFQYTLLIYHLTNRHSNNIIKTIQLLSDSMNVVLHDIPQLRKANKFLQNADDVSILSLIYFLLNLPFKNTLQLQEHEKQYVLSKTFLDNPVHAYSCLKYTKSYWQRHFLGLEKTLTSLQSLSS
jgi:hypothetical protein